MAAGGNLHPLIAAKGNLASIIFLFFFGFFYPIWAQLARSDSEPVKCRGRCKKLPSVARAGSEVMLYSWRAYKLSFVSYRGHDADLFLLGCAKY